MKTIRVNTIDVQVREVARDQLPPDADAYYASRGAPTIFVANDLERAYREFVIRHEWVHAVLHLNGIVDLDDAIEERLCDAFAHEAGRLLAGRP